MPELPELEILKIYLDATSLHQEISDVKIEDTIVLEDLTLSKLSDQLVGQTFVGSCRYGKYLFVELTTTYNLVMHFGMTGDLKYYKIPESQPKYELMRIEFANDYQLAYVMPRKFGHIYLSPDIEAFIEKKDLGPDVLDSQLDLKAFQNILDHRRGMIKTALMDQSFLAGIGNIYSDEILFQARVHPRQSIPDLDAKTIDKIYACMHDVLHTAIENDADPHRFPDDYLTPLRGRETECPNCDGKIKRLEVAGRSSYYCPECQKIA